MDSQLLERAALLQKKVFTLERDNTALRREVARLKREAPISDPNQAPVALARIAELEAEVDQLDRHAEDDAAAVRESRQAFEAMRDDWEAERKETARLQLEFDAMTRSHRVASQDHEDRERDVDELEEKVERLEAEKVEERASVTVLAHNLEVLERRVRALEVTGSSGPG